MKKYYFLAILFILIISILSYFTIIKSDISNVDSIKSPPGAIEPKKESKINEDPELNKIVGTTDSIIDDDSESYDNNAGLSNSLKNTTELNDSKKISNDTLEGDLEFNYPIDESNDNSKIYLEELTYNRNNSLNMPMLISGSVFLLILICLLITTILLLKEVRWRKRRVKNEWIVFPDAHMDVLDKLESSWRILHSQLKDMGSSSLLIHRENESLALKTIDSLSKFNSTIDAQKKEIDRLKEGYDFTIKKHSISALLEINDLVTSFLAENLPNETNERLKKIDAYIQSNLEELDIEEFNFDSGLSIRELSSDDYKIDSFELVDDDSLHDQIKETTNNGYVFIHANGRNVIKKATVKLYKKEAKNG